MGLDPRPVSPSLCPQRRRRRYRCLALHHPAPPPLLDPRTSPDRPGWFPLRAEEQHRAGIAGLQESGGGLRFRLQWPGFWEKGPATPRAARVGTRFRAGLGSL